MIEFFFDCSSPWTYLAFHNIQPMAAELGVPIAWRPILVGGIFNTVNPSVYASRENPVPAKAAYMRKDLADWARAAGLKIVFPPHVFPVNSVKAMRGCLLLEAEGKLTAFARAAFEAYWGDDLAYKLKGSTSLTQSFRMFNNLSDLGAYRMNFDLGTATRLRGWLSFQITASDRYLSTPVFGRQKNDLLLTTGLRATFAH